jgi:hypothetical protein
VKISKTMPSEGQFIAIWTYQNQVWSSTLRREGLVMYIFMPLLGVFTLLSPNHPVFSHAMYFITSLDTDVSIEDTPVTLH